MRALWSGVIQFGLVVLPVKLFSATEEHRVRLREIHVADSGKVGHRRFCEAAFHRGLPYEEVGRGWELPDGQLVPLADQDLERLPLATRHVVEVLGFVPGQDIDPISYRRPYYVGPDGPPAECPYALLVEALARTGQVGVCKVAVRSRERPHLAPRWPKRVGDGHLTSLDGYACAASSPTTGPRSCAPEPVSAVDLMVAMEASVRAAHACQVRVESCPAQAQLLSSSTRAGQRQAWPCAIRAA
ncbi:Ku protein [Streptomyces sp. NPDC057651]|uniref:Ku protein n=1 Tax=Streptomyces sp. NPDC057651 TaxID=3346194 RepID=UPI00367CBEB5